MYSGNSTSKVVEKRLLADWDGISKLMMRTGAHAFLFLCGIHFIIFGTPNHFQSEHDRLGHGRLMPNNGEIDHHHHQCSNAHQRSNVGCLSWGVLIIVLAAVRGQPTSSTPALFFGTNPLIITSPQIPQINKSLMHADLCHSAVWLIHSLRHR